MIELPFLRIRIQIRGSLWAILFIRIGSFFFESHPGNVRHVSSREQCMRVLLESGCTEQ